MSDQRAITTRNVTYSRGIVGARLDCRGCTQPTDRVIACKVKDSSQHIITPFCDQCFDVIKRLPCREIDIKIVRPS